MPDLQEFGGVKFGVETRHVQYPRFVDRKQYLEFLEGTENGVELEAFASHAVAGRLKALQQQARSVSSDIHVDLLKAVVKRTQESPEGDEALVSHIIRARTFHDKCCVTCGDPAALFVFEESFVALCARCTARRIQELRDGGWQVPRLRDYPEEQHNTLVEKVAILEFEALNELASQLSMNSGDVPAGHDVRSSDASQPSNPKLTPEQQERLDR